MEVTINLPEGITAICKIKGNELERFLKRIIAVELYRERLVSMGKAAEIAEVSRYEMMDLLNEKGVPINYAVEDLEEDMKTLGKLLKPHVGGSRYEPILYDLQGDSS